VCQEPPLGCGRGLTALPYTRDAQLLTPQTFTIRPVVCKTQWQPNEKHIVPSRTGGEQRAAPAPLLPREGSESMPVEGRRPVTPLPTPFSASCTLFPTIGSPGFAFPSRGSFGSQMWSSSLWEGGQPREREGEWPLESNRCRHRNVGSTTCTRTVRNWASF
jgi:hypothetical protein